MSIKSINEPEEPAHEKTLTPNSINEPLDPETLTPTITHLEPASCTLGDPSFRLYVSGTGFNSESMVNFAGHDEPTTLEEDGSLSTGVNMDVWNGPDTVPVMVRNGPLSSEPADFTFNEPGADPDELEEEIEEAEEEGEVVRHRGKPTHTMSHKRSKAKR